MDAQLAVGARRRRHPGRQLQRRRHDEAVVVIGVLADQIDAARRAIEPRRAAEFPLEARFKLGRRHHPPPLPRPVRAPWKAPADAEAAKAFAVRSRFRLAHLIGDPRLRDKSSVGIVGKGRRSSARSGQGPAWPADIPPSRGSSQPAAPPPQPPLAIFHKREIEGIGERPRGAHRPRQPAGEADLETAPLEPVAQAPGRRAGVHQQGHPEFGVFVQRRPDEAGIDHLDRHVVAVGGEFHPLRQRDHRRLARAIGARIRQAAIADQRSHEGDLPAPASAHRVEDGIGGIDRALRR